MGGNGVRGWKKAELHLLSGLGAGNSRDFPHKKKDPVGSIALSEAWRVAAGETAGRGRAGWLGCRGSTVGAIGFSTGDSSHDSSYVGAGIFPNRTHKMIASKIRSMRMFRLSLGLVLSSKAIHLTIFHFL